MSKRSLAIAAAGVGGGVDPNFKNVSLLLTGDGTNGAQNNTFLDSSTNNFTITRNGNTTQGSFSPYGNLWSNYFDGSGDYLSIANNAAFDLGTGDATIETWFMLTADASLDNDGVRTATLISTYSSSLSNAYGLFIGGSSTTTGTGLGFTRWASGVGTPLAYTGSISKNVWHHVAVVRSGSNLTLYYDGVSVATNNSFSGNINSWGQALNIARLGFAGYIQEFSGYLSNIRIVKGTALYTSNFTPSTTPLTAVSGTSLLTCQSNRFKDNSSNNFAITVNGNTSVQRFSPFNPTAPYSTSTIGGSGYFDGNYLSMNGGSAFAVGTGDFTLECWVYITNPTQTSNWLYIFDAYDNTNEIRLAFKPGANLQGVIGSGTLGWMDSSVTYASMVGRWTHIALVRSSGTGTMYVDGVSVSSSVHSNNIGNCTAGYPIISYVSPYSFSGYITDVRFVKGTALYTSTFTPPTAPLTAITNTSLLCNFTNAGIPDAAMQNDLETVGNAQVSTSVKKYGTGSLAFDGTTDYIVEPTNLSYGYGTGDFTIEFWLYLNSTRTQTVVSNLSSASSVNPHLYYLSGTGLYYYTNSADRIASSALSTSTWYHIALCRSSGSTKLFVNGTQAGSTYTDANDYGQSAPLGIGTYWSAGAPVTTQTLNGYIDDLRITKGYARYTANFTPPTAALPTQ